MNARIHSIVLTLRIAFGLTAFLAGLDKFFNLLTNWEQYANPMLLKLVPLSATALMRLGGYVVAAWLTLIALSLVAGGQYFDVAVRDLVMAVGAFTLARMSELEMPRVAAAA
jgi:uncharacterized membrane protein YphA (DoxX/SURF4 family)